MTGKSSRKTHAVVIDFNYRRRQIGKKNESVRIGDIAVNSKVVVRELPRKSKETILPNNTPGLTAGGLPVIGFKVIDDIVYPITPFGVCYEDEKLRLDGVLLNSEE